MAKSRFALGQVFGAVGAAASTITTTFESIDSTLGMASAAIEHSRFKQAVRHRGERKTYATEVMAEVIASQAEAEAQIAKLIVEGKITSEAAKAAADDFKADLIAAGLIPA